MNFFQLWEVGRWQIRICALLGPDGAAVDTCVCHHVRSWTGMVTATREGAACRQSMSFRAIAISFLIGGDTDAKSHYYHPRTDSPALLFFSILISASAMLDSWWLPTGSSVCIPILCSSEFWRCGLGTWEGPHRSPASTAGYCAGEDYAGTREETCSASLGKEQS